MRVNMQMLIIAERNAEADLIQVRCITMYIYNTYTCNDVYTCVYANAYRI